MSMEYEYKVSVVVIVYNTEEFLEECLDSLVNQTLDGIEIICVNDESKDESLNILRKYAKKYDNIKVINQKNQGGAIAGNTGLKAAKGEYVTMIDSDDVVVLDAYEKLYNKAKETDSDIVSGKAYKDVGNIMKALRTHNDMWDFERQMDIHKDYNLYNDTSYWNKLFKRTFVEENDIYMIPGRLYADIPLCVRAFTKAETITFIEEVVYYWRKRDLNTSITKNRYKIDNMLDKLGLYYVLKSYFDDEKLFEKVIKVLIDRFYLPIEGILDDTEFKNVYLDEMKKILKDINDPLDNPFMDNEINFYNYLILNDHPDTLVEFMKNYLDVPDTIYENGKTYWNLKYFRNPDYNFPDEIFEIKLMLSNFISIDELRMDNDFLYLDNITLPQSIKFDEVNVVFEGICFKNNFRENNYCKFKLNNEGNNNYNARIPLDEINNINVFYIYLEFKYDGFKEKYRIKRTHFTSKAQDIYNQYQLAYFNQAENFTFVNSYVKDIFSMEINDDRLTIKTNNNGQINYKIFIQHDKKNDRVFFDNILIDDIYPTNRFELNWNHSLEKDLEYKLYINIKNKIVEMTTDYLDNFKNQTIPYKSGEISICENEDKSISILWKDK